ncbi:hypothetical protein [Propionimicrobium sp. PCR01-08-3]|uniref:DUF6841 family protein n=1 Tax=Propionimicrobium sp. PCR01-08-3 TaxID=3052086 RepID=UPI00255C5CA0|nr:hypothetical protein [Propionimicrobium sp. PCR01-08-3]WIY84056.1 hypothetical protein QQ658_06885 [Propionimicrobium sp. PCR01-08-3]
MTFENAEIYGYLSEYAAAMASFDAERVAALWGNPATVLTDDDVIVAQTHAETVSAMDDSYPKLKKLGLASVGHELIEVSELSEKLVRVRVRWIFHDKDGAVLTAISYIFVLRRDDDGQLRAYIAIPMEENEKLARVAQRRGVDLDN